MKSVISTCFDNGVPSSGRLKTQKSQVRNSSARMRNDDAYNVLCFVIYFILFY